MNCIKRGWLYTTRKKGKSFLLFCILFLIAVFVLSALAIDKASSLAQDNLRKSLGGEFTIGYDYSKDNPYLNVGKRQILKRSDTELPQPFASWSNSL